MLVPEREGQNISWALSQLPFDSEQRALFNLLLKLHFQLIDEVVALGFDFVLPENMVCSMHPHFMTQDRTHSLYFQETYRVGRDRGEALSGVPYKVYHGGEASF